MNDEALHEAIRGSFDEVRMRVPASALAGRGDRFRARRRMITAGAGAVTAAAAAALVVTVAAPVSAPHSPAAARVGTSSRATTASPSTPSKPAKPSGATLAAWTVTKLGDGRLKVTIHEMHDPSALQARLRADGARVLVTGSLAAPAGCDEWKGGDYYMGSDVIRMANKTGAPTASGLEMFIRPADIPSGAALWMGIDEAEVGGATGFGYVTATTACLGS
jgi:hypothetical protein